MLTNTRRALTPRPRAEHAKLGQLLVLGLKRGDVPLGEFHGAQADASHFPVGGHPPAVTVVGVGHGRGHHRAHTESLE